MRKIIAYFSIFLLTCVMTDNFISEKTETKEKYDYRFHIFKNFTKIYVDSSIYPEYIYCRNLFIKNTISHNSTSEKYHYKKIYGLDEIIVGDILKDGYLGLTTMQNYGKIKRGRIVIDRSVIKDTFAVKMILLHEIGHFYGKKHTKEKYNIMGINYDRKDEFIYEILFPMFVKNFFNE